MQNCIFCRIIAGELPSKRVYEDDSVIAFHDIHPQAPVHVLIVPKEHVAALSDLEGDHHDMAGRLLLTVPKVAAAVGDELADGYRVVINNGPAGGQTVPHLHLHILGGRHFNERMVPPA
jgi:histidine triad (HIT) family protein